MIRFKEKQYGISTEAAIGASAGASLGVSLHKLIKGAFKPVTEKISETTPGWVDKLGNVITESEYKKIVDPTKKSNYTRKLVQVWKDGKPVMKDKVIKTSGEVLKDSTSRASQKGEAFLSKFGKVGEWLKGANRSFWNKLGSIGKWIVENPTKASIAGAAIGASIAIGYYLIKTSYNKADKALTNFKGRMIDKVVSSLKSMGYKQDIDFTTSPAQADYLKTKVCIVVSSTKDVVNITVNSVNDPKLEPVARQIIKNLPSGSKFYQRESDKSNELTLAVTHSNNGDHVYVASIVERFIKKKYPVFIVEING